MVQTHDQHDVYRGLYEWDGAECAEHYARALWRVPPGPSVAPGGRVLGEARAPTKLGTLDPGRGVGLRTRSEQRQSMPLEVNPECER